MDTKMNHPLILVLTLLCSTLVCAVESSTIDYSSCNSLLTSLKSRDARAPGYLKLIEGNKVVAHQGIEIVERVELDANTTSFIGRVTSLKYRNGRYRSKKFTIERDNNGLVERITEIGINDVSGELEDNLQYHFYFNYKNNLCQLSAMTREVLSKNKIELRFELKSERQIDRLIKQYGKTIESCADINLPCSEEFEIINKAMLSLKEDLLLTYGDDERFQIFQFPNLNKGSNYLGSVDHFIEEYIRSYSSMNNIRNRFEHPYYTLDNWVYGKPDGVKFRLYDFQE